MKNVQRISLFLLLIFQNIARAQHQNILISEQNGPNEPSICINPNNTNELVAASNIANVYFSHDAGLTWKDANPTCPWGIWGDPVIGIDAAGAFYYLHLSNPPSGGNWIDRIIAQKSTDGGKTWDSGNFMGLNGTKAQDKHWIATDFQNNNLYVSWTQFDNYGTTSSSDSSIIQFSKSIDGGQNWSPAKRINQLAGDCEDSDFTAEGAMPCVGTNGEVFVAWSNRNKIWFDRSLDGGETWLANDIFVENQVGGWDYAIPGIYRANGLPVTSCDTSGGAHDGTIYINWTDQRNGAGDTDVWLAKSTDGGNSWLPSVRVNDDAAGHQQFFTWMTIDQSNGWLWFVFYDRRYYNDAKTDVFMAVSKNGGATFTNFKVSETPFLPNESYFFGDYTNVSAANGVVRPIWTRLNDNDLSVWTALVNPDKITSTDDELSQNALFSLENPYPNPTVEGVGFSFKLRQPALIQLDLMDLQGNIRAKLLDLELRNAGKYLEKIDLAALDLASGTYFFVLNVDGKMARKKVVFSRN